jgi:hypothetical protein
MVEQRRPWMILRDTDVSKSAVAATNGWQTAIDLSTITRFSRFYGDDPVKNFDGNNHIDYYRQIPWHKRLQYREAAFTFAFNEGAKALYLNGTVNPGTLWIDYIKDSPDIAADATWPFPSWSHPLLGFFAVGIHKGGIDYDDVNARMSADNRATAAAIRSCIEAGAIAASSAAKWPRSDGARSSVRNGSMMTNAIARAAEVRRSAFELHPPRDPRKKERPPREGRPILVRLRDHQWRRCPPPPMLRPMNGRPTLPYAYGP